VHDILPPPPPSPRSSPAGLAARILVVTVNPKRRRLLMHVLRSHAFRVLEGSVGEDLPASVAFHHPDLVLLDLAGIPARSREGPDAALALVRALRAASVVPIVALATEPDAPTAAATLTAGADDYLTWPVHLGELISRIRAILRRVWGAWLPPGTRLVAREGTVVIDLARGVVQVEGRAVALNAVEWRVLTVLGRHVGQVLTHDEILCLAFGPAYRGDVPYLRVIVSRLRDKLRDGRHGSELAVLRTHFGIGYQLLAEAVVETAGTRAG